MSHNIKEIIKNLSVDCVIFGFENGCMEVLLIRRAINPQKGMWALPGGFLKKDEDIYNAAIKNWAYARNSAISIMRILTYINKNIPDFKFQVDPIARTIILSFISFSSYIENTGKP